MIGIYFFPYLVVNFLPLNGIPISPWKWLVHRNFTGVLLSTHSRRLAISLWLLLCRHQNCLFGGTCAVSKIYPNLVDILAPTFGIKSVLYPQDQLFCHSLLDSPKVWNEATDFLVTLDCIDCKLVGAFKQFSHMCAEQYCVYFPSSRGHCRKSSQARGEIWAIQS